MSECFVCFLGLHLRHMEVPRLRLESELQLALTPLPQQQRIWAGSATYAIAHGNTGSLTHWARPGIKPAFSWILVWFLPLIHNGNSWTLYFRIVPKWLLKLSKHNIGHNTLGWWVQNVVNLYYIFLMPNSWFSLLWFFKIWQHERTATTWEDRSHDTRSKYKCSLSVYLLTISHTNYFSSVLWMHHKDPRPRRVTWNPNLLCGCCSS